MSGGYAERATGTLYVHECTLAHHGDLDARPRFTLLLGGALMVTEAVPAGASSGSIVQALWFRFLVRAALALLAFGALSFAANRSRAFQSEFAARFWFDDWLWLSSVSAAIVAGLLFGLATWLPFGKIRFLPSRLALAAATLVPVAHFWWLADGHALGGWLGTLYWFDDLGIQFVMAALAGVAIASGFRAKDSTPAAE
jgi:hypothetical protein